MDKDKLSSQIKYPNSIQSPQKQFNEVELLRIIGYKPKVNVDSRINYYTSIERKSFVEMLLDS